MSKRYILKTHHSTMAIIDTLHEEYGPACIPWQGEPWVMASWDGYRLKPSDGGRGPYTWSTWQTDQAHRLLEALNR